MRCRGRLRCRWRPIAVQFQAPVLGINNLRIRSTDASHERLQCGPVFLRVKVILIRDYNVGNRELLQERGMAWCIVHLQDCGHPQESVFFESRGHRDYSPRTVFAAPLPGGLAPLAR